jgi:hypothetical protein
MRVRPSLQWVMAASLVGLLLDLGGWGPAGAVAARRMEQNPVFNFVNPESSWWSSALALPPISSAEMGGQVYDAASQLFATRPHLPRHTLPLAAFPPCPPPRCVVQFASGEALKCMCLVAPQN